MTWTWSLSLDDLYILATMGRCIKMVKFHSPGKISSWTKELLRSWFFRRTSYSVSWFGIFNIELSDCWVSVRN